MSHDEAVFMFSDSHTNILNINIKDVAEDEFTDSLQTEKLELSCLKHRTLTWRLDRSGDSRDTRVRCGGGHQQGC